MDNIPEREQPKQERVISLGEDFYPFDTKYTHREKSLMPKGKQIDSFRSQVLLDIKQKNAKILCEILTQGSVVRKGDAITPFNPEIGYQITPEDLDFKSRIRKILTKRKELREPIDFNMAPLGLSIKIHSQQDIPQVIADVERKLKVLVLFGNESFEAKPYGGTMLRHEMSFGEFYQESTGPLPVRSKEYKEDPFYLLGKDARFLGEGFIILLPSDPEKLAQIRARFVLTEEQLKDPETSSG